MPYCPISRNRPGGTPISWGASNTWNYLGIRTISAASVDRIPGSPRTLNGTVDLRAINGFSHVACTYDVATGAAGVYINGVLDVAGTVTTDALTTSVLRLGGAIRLDDSPYDGLLDDVQIYDEVLTADQIASLHANPGSTAEVPEPSTLVMLAAGLFGLLCYAWRKRK